VLRKLDTYVNATFQLLVNALKHLGLSVPILLFLTYGFSFAAFLVALYDAGERGLAQSGMFVFACFASVAFLLALGTFSTLVATPSDALEEQSKDRRDRRLDLLHMGNNVQFRTLLCFYCIVFISIAVLLADFGFLAFVLGYSLLVCALYLETCF